MKLTGANYLRKLGGLDERNAPITTTGSLGSLREILGGSDHPVTTLIRLLLVSAIIRWLNVFGRCYLFACVCVAESNCDDGRVLRPTRPIQIFATDVPGRGRQCLFAIDFMWRPREWRPANGNLSEAYCEAVTPALIMRIN